MRRLLDESQKIVIISHQNADGDAVGSSLALFHMLDGRARVVLPHGLPRTFAWLPGSDKIVNGKTEKEEAEQLLRNADLIVGIDFNAPNRVDNLEKPLIAACARKILIDHHHTPDNDHFEIVVSQPQVSSACEVLYWTAKALWNNRSLSRDIARCLYTGICTDTGSFSYSSEAPSVYEASADLVRYNIDAEEIHNKIANTFTENRLRFYGFALTERLRFFPERRFAYIYISLADQQRFGIDSSDMEGLVNYAMMLQEVDLGALVREEPTRNKVSLRSKINVDVNAIARQHFNGGGHTKASGGTTYCSFDETIQILERIFVECGER